MTTKKDRLRPLDLSSSATRSMAHTEEAVRHIDSQEGTTLKGAISKQLGINAVSSPLGTVVDVNNRSPPCGGHLLKYGLMKKMSKCIWYVLGTDQRKALLPRMNAFPYPRGMAVIQFDVTKRVGKNISMKYYRKLMLIWSLALADMFDHRSRVWQAFTVLCEVDHLIYTYWQHRNKPLLVAKTKKLVGMLDRLRPANAPKKFPKFDTPNTHQLMELVERFLPLYENVEFFDTTPLEACHKLPKNIVRQTRYYSNRHNDVAERLARQECLTYVFHGGTWGQHHSLRLGAHWTMLRDPRNTACPHPTVQHITAYCRFTEDKDPSTWLLSGEWRPAKGTKISTVENPPHELVRVMRTVLDDASMDSVGSTTRIVNTSRAREKDLCVGDDICHGDDGLRFGRILAMYQGFSDHQSISLKCMVLKLSVWKPRKGLPVIPFTFNVTASSNTCYINSENIGTQVLAVHSCNTPRSVRRCAMVEDDTFSHDYNNKNYRIRKFGLIFDNERLSPNWYRKPRDIPPNPLDSWKKYQTSSGMLGDVRVGSLAVVLVDGGKVSVAKVKRVNKKIRICRWWGGEDNPESLLGKLVALRKNGQAWTQALHSGTGVIAGNFDLDRGMLPNEVLALMDWDWRTTWNLSTEYGSGDADNPREEELLSHTGPERAEDPSSSSSDWESEEETSSSSDREEISDS